MLWWKHDKYYPEYVINSPKLKKKKKKKKSHSDGDDGLMLYVLLNIIYETS